MPAKTAPAGSVSASDTDFIVGNVKTKTFEKFWLEKLGLYKNTFSNTPMLAGTHLEHRILDSLAIPDLTYDKQILREDLLLRINYDAVTSDTDYEVKTYNAEKEFKISQKYRRQVWVQMFVGGYREAYIVAYGLKEEDYKNFFLPIDPARRQLLPVEYDEKWINETFIPAITYKVDCLRKGIFPEY